MKRITLVLTVLMWAALGSSAAVAQDPLQSALENNRTNQASTWVNPDTGESGTVVPVRTFENAQGGPCREFQRTIVIGGREEQGYGTRRPRRRRSSSALPSMCAKSRGLITLTLTTLIPTTLIPTTRTATTRRGDTGIHSPSASATYTTMAGATMVAGTKAGAITGVEAGTTVVGIAAAGIINGEAAGATAEAGWCIDRRVGPKSTAPGRRAAGRSSVRPPLRPLPPTLFPRPILTLAAGHDILFTNL
jgi:hypothetical protein